MRHRNLILKLTLVFMMAIMMTIHADADTKTETAVTDASTVETIEKKVKENKKLEAEDKDYKVSLTYKDNTDIPEDAVLVFKEVKDQSYFKDSMKELNITDQEAKTYKGRFFEVKVESNGKTVKVDTDVDIDISFKKDININNKNKIHIVNILDKDIHVIKDKYKLDIKDDLLKSIHLTTDQLGIIGELYSTEASPVYKKATFKDKAGNLQVHVKAPEGAFPEGTKMKVAKVANKKIKKTVEKTVEGEVKKISAVDISFTYEGKEISPEKEIAISITDTNSNSKDPLTLVHIDNNKANTINAKQENNEYTFKVHDTNVYALVETKTITTEYITAEGKTYEVTITYGPEAELPEGCTLEVSELSKKDSKYDSYAAKAAKAVGSTVDTLNYIKVLDISIISDGKKVQPKANVDVKINLLDKDKKDVNTQVVHFSKGKTDLIEPKVDGNTVSFETDGFSYYAVTAHGSTNDLAGKHFAIAQVNTKAVTHTGDQDTIGNDTKFAGRSLTSTTNGNGLGGTTVSVEKHESGYNIVTTGNTKVEEWNFEAAPDGGYYIKSNNTGQYLNLNNNTLTLSSTPMALTVTAGTGTYAGKVKITSGNNVLQSSASANENNASTNQYFRSGRSTDDNYVWLTLCDIYEYTIPTTLYSGEIISAGDLTPHDSNGHDYHYLIGKQVYNNVTGQYEDWVIDGNGKAVKAYDHNDSLSLYSDVSVYWTFQELIDSNGNPNGYYIFKNAETGMILHPMADGTLVKPYNNATSPAQDGVSLKGRQYGDYNSTIEFWDESVQAYYGYTHTIDSDGIVTLTTGTGTDSHPLSFARAEQSNETLHTVDTIDSTANGITIRMFDYPNRAAIEAVTGTKQYHPNGEPIFVQYRLNAQGYPVFNRDNGQTTSGESLFSENTTYYRGRANHLFLDNVYESTGFYSYSAFDNFAHYNGAADGNFTVYQEIGTPRGADNSDYDNRYYFKRGNFMPFDTLDTSQVTKNLFNGDGVLYDYSNPDNADNPNNSGSNAYTGSRLYGTRGPEGNGPDYYFGMTMEFDYMMAKDGIIGDEPMIYEFNGDDDLWIYIDGVLVLDIGGVHDALSGKVDLSTGEITGINGGAGGAKTIKDCFKNAGVFPDGTAWDDSKVDQYFRGNTFIDYSKHSFKMFYMEHGSGASNLYTRFNLPVVQTGNVVVEKKLTDNTQTDYANVQFAYQVFKRNTDHDVAVTEANYEGRTDTNGNPVPITFHNGVEFNGITYNNVFYLKPGEAAVIPDMADDQEYYVKEIGVDPTLYDAVYVNDVQVTGDRITDNGRTYESTVDTVKNRSRVTYTNHTSDANSNDLLITKRLDEKTSDNGDTFEFRVMLEDANGVLSAYYQGTYYIKDDSGNYYKYVNGELVLGDDNGATPYACTAGNYGTIAKIPPDYTVVIPNLIAGTDFYVDEIRVRPNGSTSDVLIGNSNWELVSRVVSDEDPSQISDATIWDYATSSNTTGASLGRIKMNTDAKVVFTNKRKGANVKLKKVKNDGQTIIGDSNFKIFKQNGQNWVQISDNFDKITIGSTVDNNPANLGELPIGRYQITETVAPDGYLLPSDPIYIEVYQDTDDTRKVRVTDADGTVLTNEQLSSDTNLATIDTNTETIEGISTTVYVIVVKNIPGEELPFTGGSGIQYYTLSGLTLMCLTTIMYILKKRRRERRMN